MTDSKHEGGERERNEGIEPVAREGDVEGAGAHADDEQGARISRRRILEAGWTLPVVLAWRPADGTGGAPPSDEVPPSDGEALPTEPSPTEPEPGLFHIDWFDHYDSGHTDSSSHGDTDHYDSGSHTDFQHGDRISHWDSPHTDLVGPHADGGHSDLTSHTDYSHWDSTTGHMDESWHYDGGHTDYTNDG